MGTVYNREWRIHKNHKMASVQVNKENGKDGLVAFVPLTLQNIEEIENDFEIYDVVSLVFLLYDADYVALEKICLSVEYGCKTGLITDWIKSVQNKDLRWQYKLLEALTIVQCFSVLRKLGYSKHDMLSRFLPFQPNAHLFVHPIKKCLYRLCEDLDKDGTAIFLYHVKQSFIRKNLNFKEYDNRYLEMYILHWCIEKFIRINKICQNDVSNLIKILKTINMENYSTNLESITNHMNGNNRLDFVNNCSPVLNQNETQTENMKINVEKSKKDSDTNSDTLYNSNKIFQEITSSECDRTKNEHEKIDVLRTDIEMNNRQSGVQMSFNPSYSVRNEDECYHIDKENIGICIVINQKKFYRETDKQFVCLLEQALEERKGTDCDKEKLIRTWSSLGFKMCVFEDLNHLDIKEKIRQTIEVEFQQKHSCLVVCILSHGIPDAIYGANSIPIYVSTLENLLYDKQFRTLRGKPKVLIIQACQGTPCQEVVPLEEAGNRNENIQSSINRELTTDGVSNVSLNTVPQKSDLLICWSTISGYASVRNKKKGSWFIDVLCECINKDAGRKHFVDIITSVNGIVSKKRWDRENGKSFCMMPEIRNNTFTKLLYLRELTSDPLIVNKFQTE